jgi:site-specific DNA-methyltransferase (adenine-specific)
LINSVIHGDCLEVMKDIPDKSVDMILCDLPYGTTACKWDTIIPFGPLWEQYERIIKDNGAIVLFSKQPFTTTLIQSNIKNYKYSLVWRKDNHDNPMQAKRRFLNVTEDINVFYKKQCIYNPQGIIEVNKTTKQGNSNSLVDNKANRPKEYKQQYTNYPRNILEFKRDLPNVHPTQKPVLLLEYLIETYTNKDGIILDNTAGSGSTGVAAINTGRNYILIEKEKEYIDVINKRISEHTREV